MNPHIIFAALNQYKKARILFVQAATEIALQSECSEYLNNPGIIENLCPLLWDVMPSVQKLATIALARLANCDYTIAFQISKNKIFFQLLKNIEKQSVFFKKAALFLLRNLVVQSLEITVIVISEGGLEATNLCLQDTNNGVREAAAWTIGYIARHNECSARAVVDTGAVPLLVCYLRSSEFCLIQSGASALCDISKHTLELAQAVVDAGTIPLLVGSVFKQDGKPKQQIVFILACIAKHSEELSKSIIQPELFLEIFSHVTEVRQYFTRAVTTLVKVISKHSSELSDCVVAEQGIKFLIEVINAGKALTRLFGIVALGYIAGYSNEKAMTIIEMKGVHSLSRVLENQDEIHILTVGVWTIGQIGKHSYVHANIVAQANTLINVLMLYNNPVASQDLKIKCKTTLQLILQKCTEIEVLKPLLHNTPSNILKYILAQLSKVLPIDSNARRLFISTGCLKMVQKIQVKAGSSLPELITMINCCFPEEIIRSDF